VPGMISSAAPRAASSASSCRPICSCLERSLPGRSGFQPDMPDMSDSRRAGESTTAGLEPLPW
jgi:hypothetical protein